MNYPSLRAAKRIAIDVETYDPDLKSKGPGPRRDGYVIGVAVATDGLSAYYPVRHAEGRNEPPARVFDWLARELDRDDVTIVGANLLYDLDFLQYEGVHVYGDVVDVLVAEALLDENKPGEYSLDAVAKARVGERKLKDAIADECARRGLKGDPRANLWRLPGELVASYAIRDVELPLKIWGAQRPLIEEQGLARVFDIEMRLTPMLLFMRTNGVRIDRVRLRRLADSVARRLQSEARALDRAAGTHVEYNAAASVAAALDRIGVTYPRTAKTDAPSFRREWLETQDDVVSRLVVSCRRYHKFLNTFLIGQIGDQLIGDRIHCILNQTKSDEYGAKSGRFSASNPNTQFIPARDSELGPACRAIFVPEPGYSWGKADYSQIEFRIFAHYAEGEGAERFRAAYQANPLIDFHQWCADESELDRRIAKNLNFGKLYGIGVDKTARNFKMTRDRAIEFIKAYDEKFPFARATTYAVARAAERRGWVRTILGRRARFERWEPADWNLARTVAPFTDRAEAVAYVENMRRIAIENGNDPHVPGVRRAKTYTALNRLIQGSAADVMKQAMVDVWESGACDYVIPHLTVHDELDCSVEDSRIGREAWEAVIKLMEDAIEFKVPIVVDANLQKNWGEK